MHPSDPPRFRQVGYNTNTSEQTGQGYITHPQSLTGKAMASQENIPQRVQCESTDDASSRSFQIQTSGIQHHSQNRLDKDTFTYSHKCEQNKCLHTISPFLLKLINNHWKLYIKQNQLKNKLTLIRFHMDFFFFVRIY